MMRPATFASFSCCRGPRRAFSLVELLVVIGILGLLAAILLPVLFSARAKAHTTECAANLRQIGVALQNYVSDYDGTYPPAVEGSFVNNNSQTKYPTLWYDLLTPYTNKRFPMCPDRIVPDAMEDRLQTGAVSGYALNRNMGETITLSSRQKTLSGIGDNVVRMPSLIVVVFDARVGYVAETRPDNEKAEMAVTQGLPFGATRHQNGANYLFADGHVKWFVPSGLTTGEKGDGVHPGFGL